jgi:hypothetical protein
VGLKILYIILFLVLPLPAFGDIYQWVDEAGIIHFTNVVPSEKKFQKVMKEDTRTKSKTKKASSTNPVLKHPEPVSKQDYSVLIKSVSERYQIDPALVRAIIRAESNFRVDAISKKGARGLMQLMPQTANELNVKNCFDPEENIDGGVRYLRYLLDIFDGNLSLSLAAYNAGPELVQRLGGIPPIKETRDYVRRVLRLYNGPGIIDNYKTPIYKIVFDDGTIIFTNTPYNYHPAKRAMENM